MYLELKKAERNALIDGSRLTLFKKKRPSDRAVFGETKW